MSTIKNLQMFRRHLGMKDVTWEKAKTGSTSCLPLLGSAVQMHAPLSFYMGSPRPRSKLALHTRSVDAHKRTCTHGGCPHGPREQAHRSLSVQHTECCLGAQEGTQGPGHGPTGAPWRQGGGAPEGARGPGPSHKAPSAPLLQGRAAHAPHTVSLAGHLPSLCTGWLENHVRK